MNGYPFASADFGAAGAPLLRIRDVVPGFTSTRYSGPIPDGFWVKTGDLVVGMDGDFNANIWSGESALLNQRVCKLEPDPEQLDLRFLFYVLPPFLRWINLHTPSVTVKHLSSRTLQALPLPLPDIKIQHRLVARIDELFTEVADGETALTRARTDLHVYRRSLLKAAVTGELTADWRAANPPNETGADLLARISINRLASRQLGPRHARKLTKSETALRKGDLPQLPAEWTWATLPQLGEFGRGKSKHRPRDDAQLYGGPYPFVQTGVVSNSGGKILQYNQTYSNFGLVQSKLWPAGTVCITIAANIAKSGVLMFDACFPDSVVGLSCTEGVLPEFVHLAIANLQAALERAAPATAQKNINLDVLEQVAVPLPPSDEQFQIVTRFDDCLAAADLVSRDELDDEIASLRQSILAAAFRGELAA